jgi:diguanylate cyclase (GGDEF)-like protein
VALMTVLFLAGGVASLAGLQYRTERLIAEQTLARARAHAREFEALRLYVTSHGGIYVPESTVEQTNPHLTGLAGGDISLETSAGALVLRNSPLVAKGVSDHLTELTRNEPITLRMASERPLNSANMADDFDRASLALFRGDPRVTEHWAQESSGDTEYFRYASPIIATQECVRCHPHLAPTIGEPFAVLSVDMDITSVSAHTIQTRWWTLAAILTFALAVLGGVRLVVIGTLNSLRESQIRLFELARTDPLTGLANRRAVELRLTEELERFRRDGTDVAVAVIDLDDFKLVNDLLGHGEGDAALTLVADTLRAQSRLYDVVGRTGGEEFLVIMTGTNPEQAAETTERIRDAVAQALRAAIPQLDSIGASAGVTTARPGDNCDGLVRRADAAMYDAKRTWKNRTVLS